MQILRGSLLTELWTMKFSPYHWPSTVASLPLPHHLPQEKPRDYIVLGTNMLVLKDKQTLYPHEIPNNVHGMLSVYEIVLERDDTSGTSGLVVNLLTTVTKVQ
jgi:hypothetical protein